MMAVCEGSLRPRDSHNGLLTYGIFRSRRRLYIADGRLSLVDQMPFKILAVRSIDLLFKVSALDLAIPYRSIICHLHVSCCEKFHQPSDFGPYSDSSQ